MIKVEKINIWGLEHAIRGMRNPLNSWEKSDSTYVHPEPDYRPEAAFYIVGERDLALMRKLYRAGSEHRKYLRQIFVSMDIVAPLYFWKQMDTYKIGVTSSSCSNMHTIMNKPFEIGDFSIEHLNTETKFVNDGLFVNNETNLVEDIPFEITLTMKNTLGVVVDMLNIAREKYLETKDKNWWWQIIQLLPSSYNQRRTITMNYENVFNIIHQREYHKLDEWKEFVKVLKEELPYVKEIGGFENE